MDAQERALAIRKRISGYDQRPYLEFVAEQAAREKALEEAAEVAKRFGVATYSPAGVELMHTCAEKIRALKEVV